MTLILVILYIHNRRLHGESDLFLFFGHGGGEEMCEARKLRRVVPHCPSAWLWGCSSGRLRSSAVHPPHGLALAYLLSGGRQVLGALWDVTDRDLDKVSLDTLGRLLGPDAQQGGQGCLSEALLVSRESCRLPYAVGVACVVYGLPCALTYD